MNAAFLLFTNTSSDFENSGICSCHILPSATFFKLFVIVTTSSRAFKNHNLRLQKMIS